MNINDMACVYLTEGGLKNISNRGLVLKSNVTGPIKRAYSSHVSASESAQNKFRGVKGRYTNSITDSEHIGPLWLQFPNLSEEELPTATCPTGVRIVEVEGMTIVSCMVYVYIQ